MLIGEDKNKVRNIIQPNMAEFERIYEPHLSSLVERTADGRMRTVSVYAGATSFLVAIATNIRIALQLFP